jgi:hypothetical protein
MVGQAFGQSDVAPESVEEITVIAVGEGVEFGKSTCGTVCPDPPSIRKAATAADVIFVGQVESLTIETRPLDLGPDAIKIDEQITIIGFSMTQLLKGEASDELTVRTYSNGLCGLDLKVGDVQLVYATLSEEQLWIHIGMRSSHANDASAEIAKLRKRFTN